MIDRELTLKIARLAAISLDEEQTQQISISLNNIFTYFEKLGELNLESIEPMTSCQFEDLILREDSVNDPLKFESLKANAPCLEKRFVKVPIIVE